MIGNMNKYISAYSQHLPSVFEYKGVSALRETGFYSGKLDLNTDSPHYPERSDLKIMRDDITACIVVIKEMLAREKYAQDRIANMPLYSANGAFVDKPEKHLKRMPQMYNSFTPEMTAEEKRKKIYKMSPPLIALETLTNSSMSFIAQYVGLKGQNTTFGNTSIGAFYALKQALTQLEIDPENNAIVSASNCGDTYSFLTNSGVLGIAENWRESAAVGNLICTASADNALCEITFMAHDTRIPNLELTGITRNWSVLLPQENADLLIYSGAFTDEVQAADKKYIESTGRKSMSLFEKYGNVGSANITLGIIHGIKSFSETIKTVDILDRDVYGRESIIRIEAC
jgi:hypothetical protein